MRKMAFLALLTALLALAIPQVFAADGDKILTLGVDQEVIGLAVGVGAVVAVTRDGAADQRRIVLPQALQRKAELVHRARLEVLQQDVGAGDQLFE